MISMADAPLRLVVDASVLIAEIMRRSGRARLAHPSLDLFIPEYTWGEVRHELPKRVDQFARRHMLTLVQQERVLKAGLESVERNVTVVPALSYLPMEAEARWRIARDPRDWPTVALALVLGSGIWTEDRDFLGCGVATWSTSTLTHLLELLDAEDQ
jgi:predicted nucleic acid-binding protein